MNRLIRTLLHTAMMAALLTLTGVAHATIFLTPANTLPGLYGPSNCEPSCVETTFSTSNLDLLYKASPSDAEEGSFAGSYATQFLDTPTDPSGALITYTGGSSIVCGECYLAIKDGRQTPGYYFYDLSSWNGTESISLSNFWPEQGAISHVSIWGKTASVPEPATMGLFGLGLMGVAAMRRKRTIRQ